MSDENAKGAAEARSAKVAALEEERRGYEVRGLKDRVALVDAELARFGKAPKGRAKRQTDEG